MKLLECVTLSSQILIALKNDVTAKLGILDPLPPMSLFVANLFDITGANSEYYF